MNSVGEDETRNYKPEQKPMCWCKQMLPKGTDVTIPKEQNEHFFYLQE